VIVIPVVVRTTEDMLTLVPRELREAATRARYARAYVIRDVCYRAARRHDHRVLLAVARISGETGPVIHRAQQPVLQLNMNAPMASLPAVIFQFALKPYQDWQRLAWVGALIITLTVLATEHYCPRLSAQGKLHEHVVRSRRLCLRTGRFQHAVAGDQLEEKVTVKKPRLLLRDNRALKSINVPLYTQK